MISERLLCHCWLVMDRCVISYPVWFDILAAGYRQPAAASSVCCESGEWHSIIWSAAVCNWEPAAISRCWLCPRPATCCLQLCLSPAEPRSQHPHCRMYSKHLLILALFVCIAIVKQISEWSSRSVSCQCCNRCGGQTPYIWTVLIHIRYVICNVTYVCVNETLDVVLCMFTRVLMVGRW